MHWILANSPFKEAHTPSANASTRDAISKYSLPPLCNLPPPLPPYTLLYLPNPLNPAEPLSKSKVDFSRFGISEQGIRKKKAFRHSAAASIPQTPPSPSPPSPPSPSQITTSPLTFTNPFPSPAHIIANNNNYTQTCNSFQNSLFESVLKHGRPCRLVVRIIRVGFK